MKLLKRLEQLADARRAEQAKKKPDPTKGMLTALLINFVMALVVVIVAVIFPEQITAVSPLALLVAGGYIAIFYEIYSGDIVLKRGNKKASTDASGEPG